MLAVLVGLTLEYDECLDGSVARYSALSIPNSIAAAAYDAATGDNVADVLALIETSISPVTSPYMWSVYVGLGNDNFYGVASCTYSSLASCESDDDLLYYVRNEVVHGDGHFYWYYSLADVRNVENYGSTGSDFVTTERPWYTEAVANEETEVWHTFLFLTGTIGRAFTDRSAYDGTYGMIKAADQLVSEPCDFCIEALDLPAITISAARDEGLHTAMGSTTLREDMVKFVYYYLTALPHHDTTALFVATPGAAERGYIYGVFDCKTSLNSACYSTSYRYPVYVVDGSTEGNGLNFFEFDESTNTLAATPFAVSDNEYNSTSRPWYVQGNGWSAPYTYSNQAITARSYAKTFRGGVVGTDPTPLAITQACFSPSAALTGSLLVVTVSLLAHMVL